MIHKFEDAQNMINEQELMACEEFTKLPGEELLSIWEQTQTVEFEVRSRFGTAVSMAPNYEKIILMELHKRLLKNTLIFQLPEVKQKKLRKPRAKRTCPRPLYTRG